MPRYRAGGTQGEAAGQRALGPEWDLLLLLRGWRELPVCNAVTARESTAPALPLAQEASIQPRPRKNCPSSPGEWSQPSWTGTETREARLCQTGQGSGCQSKGGRAGSLLKLLP